MKKNTANAIQTRLDKGETQFFIGDYYYDCSSGMVRRREQQVARTPTSDWERVGSCCNGVFTAFEFTDDGRLIVDAKIIDRRTTWTIYKIGNTYFKVPPFGPYKAIHGADIVAKMTIIKNYNPGDCGVVIEKVWAEFDRVVKYRE